MQRPKVVNLPENDIFDLDSSTENFIRCWNKMDDTIKELVSSGLHMLTLRPGEIIEGLADARFALTPEKSGLLHVLADWTKNR